MGCGVRHAGCGLCAPAARGRGRESGEGRGHRAEAGDSGEQRSGEGRGQQRERAQGRETASPMVLHCVVGE